MRIQSNVQSLSSALQQKMGQQERVKTVTDRLNSGAGTGIQLSDAKLMSEESKTRWMQRNGVQKNESTNRSTVELAAQSQTNALLNAQKQDATTDTIDLADQVRQGEEMLNRIAAKVAIDTKREFSAAATVNSGTSTFTGSVYFSDGESSQFNQAGSTQMHNAAAGKTENQAVKSDGNTSTNQDLRNRFQSTMQALAAGTYARVDQATQTNAHVAANTNSTVTDVSVQEETKKLTQVTAATGEQTQTRPVLRQMGTAALSQANQTTQQALSLMRG